MNFERESDWFSHSGIGSRPRDESAGMLLLIRVMCTLVAVFGGFVSNNSDSEMRELNAQAAEFDLLAWAFSWSEPHVDKRKGQCSNRKLNGPSGSFSTGRDCRKEISGA